MIQIICHLIESALQVRVSPRQVGSESTTPRNLIPRIPDKTPILTIEIHDISSPLVDAYALEFTNSILTVSAIEANKSNKTSAISICGVAPVTTNTCSPHGMKVRSDATRRLVLPPLSSTNDVIDCARTAVPIFGKFTFCNDMNSPSPSSACSLMESNANTTETVW